MNFFDYLIIIVIALSTIGSFFRGFTRELISLVIWIVGVFAALKWSPVIAPHVLVSMHSSLASYSVSFFVIFLSIWLIGLLISLAIRSVLHRVGLGLLDRLVGLIFGFIRGVFLMAVVMMFIDASALANSPTIQTSLLAPRFHAIAVTLTGFIPDDLKKRLSMNWKQDVEQ